MAHKKAAGSAKNLRDSNPKYRGVKVVGGQFARAWNIIIRQKGDKYKAWNNVYTGKDYSIHAMVDGIVSFRRKNFVRFDWRKYLKTVVDIIPVVAQQVQDTPVKKSSPKASTPKAAAPKEQAKPTPAKTTTKDTAKTTDLSELEWVWPKTKQALQDGGIMSVEDLATADISHVKQALEAAGWRTASMDPTPWIEQAKTLS